MIRGTLTYRKRSRKASDDEPGSSKSRTKGSPGHRGCSCRKSWSSSVSLWSVRTKTKAPYAGLYHVGRVIHLLYQTPNPPPHKVCGSVEWTAHVEKTHDPRHAPQLDTWRRAGKDDDVNAVCPFLCRVLIKDGSSLVVHIQRYHIGIRSQVVVPRERVRDWLAYARTTIAIWTIARSLVLCPDCGWVGTADRGLAGHIRCGMQP